ncbi:DUF2326 domain-containing protein [Wohlfahrtiimonas chitiniclastica]|uniref:DUF2326 domain-containing protein n=1 Tax=Wohlfahrtiimonas chitiniclastica TaxID=400946 RepID=UPI001BCABD9F|nr:DUF2326 domain-containing protein [Wohlfahrtiimonas chitiniclastica]MBS7818800.1 DUF2326 domain-containing protein [Wohlfahrtiimonas chitiniclastica]
MYLKKIVITKSNGDVVRDIPFKKGMNVILGESYNGGSTNSLGKTTLIRALNFCLGGKFDEFYTDQENKGIENTIVKQYLISNGMKFELILSTSLEKQKSDLSISRIVQISDKKCGFEVHNYINNEKLTNKVFLENLNKVIFKTHINNPTFRSLIPKFLRMENSEISSVLKYLGTYKSDVEYSQIWFCFFGFRDLKIIVDRKGMLKSLKDVTQLISSLKQATPSGTQQKIPLVESELKEKTALRDSFNIDEKYERDDNKLGELNSRIIILESEISNLEISKDIFLKRKTLLSADKFNEDARLVQNIYDEMDLFKSNEAISNKFEQTVEFHNYMLESELAYVLDRISEIDRSLEVKQSEYSEVSIGYNEILKKLGTQGALAKYTSLNNEIEKLTADLASLQAFDKQHSELLSQKEDLEEELKEIEERLNGLLKDFNEKLNIFNEYFAKNTEELYGERWLIAFDEEKYSFSVETMESNAGTGKKQNIVAAFDIAYMKFIKDPRISLPYPNFASQDRIEIIDAKDLNKIKELLDEAQGQLIFPIIEDKFNSLNMKYEDVVLTLNMEDRFFKIP